MKFFLTGFLVAIFIPFTGKTQLLSITPDFPKDNDNISITVDASKGNQGLFNYATVSDVYVHTGVITNLSTSSTDWRYVKFNQNFNQPNAQLQATSLGANRWKFDITNIRAYYGVPAGETIQKISILFRNGAGTTVQRNADASDMTAATSIMSDLSDAIKKSTSSKFEGGDSFLIEDGSNLSLIHI